MQLTLTYSDIIRCIAKNVHILILLSCFLLVSSCVPATYINRSTDSKYSSLIGKQIRLKKNIMAEWVTTDINYRQPASHVVLLPSPGVGGPEIIRIIEVGSGVMFEITSVITTRSLGILFERYVIKEIGSNHLCCLPIHVKVANDTSNATLGLDPNLWEVVPEEK